MCCCVEVISPSKLVKAQKEYYDDCADFIMESLHWLREGNYGKLEFKEWRAIAESIRNHWKIKKGTIHEVQVNKMDGEIYSFRSMPAIIAICTKYDLYPEC